MFLELELSGYKLVFSYHSNFLFERDTLLKLTKKQGKKNYRKDPKLNIDLDIVVYVFQYSSGLCFYYENNTQDRKLGYKFINLINADNIYIKNIGILCCTDLNLLDFIGAPMLLDGELLFFNTGYRVSISFNLIHN